MRAVCCRSTSHRRRWWWTLLVLLPAVALAAPPTPPQVQQIHKCRVAGVATFQRHACADGQAEQAWEVDVVPAQRQHAARIDAIRRELQARRRALDVQRAAPHEHHPRRRTPHRDGSAPRRRARASPHVMIPLQQQSLACTAARRQRETAYAKAGMQRGFALSRRMDDRVFHACR